MSYGVKTLEQADPAFAFKVYKIQVEEDCVFTCDVVQKNNYDTTNGDGASQTYNRPAGATIFEVDTNDNPIYLTNIDVSSGRIKVNFVGAD